METIILGIIKGLDSSGGVSFAISLAALIIGGVLYFRKTNIEQVTTVGTLQREQVESLMKQIEFLSAELTKARTQLAEIHEQNIHLMEQIRDSNRRIQELENMLDKQKG